MKSVRINILDQKAKGTISELEDQKLIAIEKDEVMDKFLKTLEKIRERGKKYPITLEEITEEVEKVRLRRYDAQKSSH